MGLGLHDTQLEHLIFNLYFQIIVRLLLPMILLVPAGFLLSLIIKRINIYIKISDESCYTPCSSVGSASLSDKCSSFSIFWLQSLRAFMIALCAVVSSQQLTIKLINLNETQMKQNYLLCLSVILSAFSKLSMALFRLSRVPILTSDWAMRTVAFNSHTSSLMFSALASDLTP